MIYFITGVPGSGKSAFAVNLIYESFVNEKSKTYNTFDYCYTNINGFKIDDERLKGRVHWLDFDIVVAFATLDYNLLQLNKHIQNYDDEILSLFDYLERSEYPHATSFNLPDDFSYYFEKLKGHKFKKCLFVIDECHNFFDKKSSVLIRWLTYHRHFYQDICLITQDLALVDASYKTSSITDSYYKAFNPRFRLFSNHLRYEKNANPRFFAKTKLEILTVKADPKIFELYTSGENRKQLPFVYKLIFICVICLFLFIFVIRNAFSTHEEEPKSYSPAGTTSSVLSFSKTSSVLDKDYVCFVCSSISCSLKTKIIPVELLTKYVKEGALEVITRYESRKYSRFCFLAPVGFWGGSSPVETSKDLNLGVSF